MRFELINCKPVPAKLAPELRAMGLGSDITLFSADRTQDGVNYARSRGCSLSSQAELFNGFARGLPGFNPANRPGQSTHERRNDGIAYSGWVGMPLRYWQVGLDTSNSGLLCQRARERGWTATVTYPGNPREGHHVNFRKEPILNVFKPLKRGAGGPRVAAMTRSLAYLGFLKGVSPRRGQGRFTREVEAALKAFQRKYNLQPDGIYGVHTARQLKVSNRGRKRCRKTAKRITNPKDRQAALRKCDRRFGPN